MKHAMVLELTEYVSFRLTDVVLTSSAASCSLRQLATALARSSTLQRELAFGPSTVRVHAFDRVFA